jgi:hypothetical protein
MGPGVVADEVTGGGDRGGRDPDSDWARLPTRKKVARTSRRARISSRRGVQAGLGPSSKVRASSPGRGGDEGTAEELRAGNHGGVGVTTESESDGGCGAEGRVDPRS